MAVGRRLAMAVVWLGVLGGYVAAALLAWWGLSALWAIRPGPWATLAAVGIATPVVGYLSYRYGAGRLNAGIDAVEGPAVGRRRSTVVPGRCVSGWDS